MPLLSVSWLQNLTLTSHLHWYNPFRSQKLATVYFLACFRKKIICNQFSENRLSIPRLSKKDFLFAKSFRSDLQLIQSLAQA